MFQKWAYKNVNESMLIRQGTQVQGYREEAAVVESNNCGVRVKRGGADEYSCKVKE